MGARTKSQLAVSILVIEQASLQKGRVRTGTLEWCLKLLKLRSYAIGAADPTLRGGCIVKEPVDCNL